MPNYQRIVWVSLAVAAIAILALGYFLFLAPAAGEKAVTVPETASLAKTQELPAEAAEEKNDPTVVPLDLDIDRSDAAVRQMVAAGEVPQLLKKWLERKDIVRTVVAVVDGIARGESPRTLLVFMAPAEKFPVIEKRGKLFMDPRGFRRYDPLVGAFMAIPDRTWVTWYRTLRPTLEKAFQELGYPETAFAQRLQQAIEHLSQAPMLQKETELEQKVMSYAFADSGLENLSPAQKHLLRTGPANALRIQKKLRTLSAELKKAGSK